MTMKWVREGDLEGKMVSQRVQGFPYEPSKTSLQARNRLSPARERGIQSKCKQDDDYSPIPHAIKRTARTLLSTPEKREVENTRAVDRRALLEPKPGDFRWCGRLWIGSPWKMIWKTSRIVKSGHTYAN